MELRQLRYLVALADQLNFTRAAESQHIAQPALSQQIRRLEDEVGVALVDRTTRRVSMTEAGELLVERGRRVLAEVDAAAAELEDLAGVRSGRVSIGAMQTLGAFDLAALLAEFHRRHPHVDLGVREGTSDTLAALLHSDELDLALLSVTDQIDTSGLELRRLMTEPMVMTVPAEHRFAGRRKVRFAEFRDDEFISFREGGAMRHLLVAAGEACGFAPHITFESNEVPRIRTLVAAGLGVAMLPRSGVREAPPGLAVVNFHEPSLTRDVTLAWRAGRRLPPAARALLELALPEG